MSRRSEQSGRAARRRTRRTEAGPSDQRAVLIVENSHSVAQMVAMYIGDRTGRACTITHTLAAAHEALASQETGHWLAAVVNLELPDAMGEEIVAATALAAVPTIVLTGTLSDAMRRRILRHDVVDYCLKGKPGIDALVRTLERLQRNPSIKVLITDEVPASRAAHARMLRAHRLQVLEASSGERALELLAEQPDVSLLLAELGTAGVDAELVLRVRERADSSSLAIIGLAGDEAPSAAIRFLKAGGSDLLRRPYEKEEYFCRIYAWLDLLANLRSLSTAAFMDSLTGAANRLGFFRTAPPLFAEAVRSKQSPAVALLMIDHLKRLNQERGYAAGDALLRDVAQAALELFGKRALLARFGSDEFCLFLPHSSAPELRTQIQQLKAALLESASASEERSPATLTIGAALFNRDDSLDALINRADQALDEAANAGADRVLLLE